MRLAQLARKLSLSQSEIVAFLASANIQIEDNANTKLADEHSETVTRHFAPHLLVTITEEFQPVESEKIMEAEIKIPITEPEVEELTSATEAEIINPPTDVEELPEIIRAPKIELTGLKVLGKIDLPGIKQKEELEENSSSSEVGEPIAEAENKKTPYRDTAKRGKRKPSPRPVKNPLALAREREHAEEQEKRKAEAARRKQIKTQNYIKSLKQKAPAKRAKVEKAPPRVKPVKKEIPKTLWGKFLRWLTT